MTPDTWVQTGIFITAAVAIFMRDRNQAISQAQHQTAIETRTEMLGKRVDHLEAKFEREVPSMMEAALNKWELGFRERLNGTYAKSMVAGVEARIEALSRSHDEFREKYRDTIRHEVRSAMQGGTPSHQQ